MRLNIIRIGSLPCSGQLIHRNFQLRARFHILMDYQSPIRQTEGTRALSCQPVDAKIPSRRVAEPKAIGATVTPLPRSESTVSTAKPACRTQGTWKQPEQFGEPIEACRKQSKTHRSGDQIRLGPPENFQKP